ncbi:glycosyltransferase [Microbulbifer rhizosphaerae]|uniref:Glycosyltransferase involved in cell wall biosynthesis n=1 Tax=Microbulbifer rhizosphaerae TaxID=1562603 RepID=A0A7W4WFC5_9GAMM|nr:glycosyltransferase [Microbulbifer rhizosphaerae]MBB3063181.1 glycosyltransferase involved in cell wall biosynthesis [Microbulbifer rhizosphaerae]
MSILINLYNQIAAGPKNISLNLIREILNSEKWNFNCLIIVPNIDEYSALKQSHRIKLLKLPIFNNVFLKISFRIYLEIILIPYLCSKCKIKKILAFGNFLFSPVRVKKIVLLHHPYIVDDLIFSRLSLADKIIETLKRIAFRASLHNVHNAIVQSGYMHSLAIRKWSDQQHKFQIIPNPISAKLNKVFIEPIDQLIANRLESMNKSVNLLYVSRFYPHKNHQFLLELSRHLNKIGIMHTITVTVNPEISEAKLFIGELSDSNVSIINVGELEQEKLIEHYKKAGLFLFSSRSETFGNPLIEAMRFALPIVVPSLGYAHSIVGESGTYYQEDSVLACAQKIVGLSKNKQHYRQKSLESFNQFKSYPDIEEWLNQYLAMMR